MKFPRRAATTAVRIDFARKREILPWIEKLKNELGIPVLYVTHSADEMARLADQLVVMAAGKVRRQGPLEEVLADVKMPIETENGSSVVLSGRISTTSAEWKTSDVEAGGWQLETPTAGLAVGSAVRLRVLARDVSIAAEKPEGISIRNRLPAVVEEIADVADEPAYRLVKLKCPTGEGRLVSRVLAQSAAELGLMPGKAVWALVKASAVIM